MLEERRLRGTQSFCGHGGVPRPLRQTSMVNRNAARSTRVRAMPHFASSRSPCLRGLSEPAARERGDHWVSAATRRQGCRSWPVDWSSSSLNRWSNIPGTTTNRGRSARCRYVRRRSCLWPRTAARTSRSSECWLAGWSSSSLNPWKCTPGSSSSRDRNGGENGFPPLRFYCDWAVHTEKDRVTPAMKTIMEGVFASVRDQVTKGPAPRGRSRVTQRRLQRLKRVGGEGTPSRSRRSLSHRARMEGGSSTPSPMPAA